MRQYKCFMKNFFMSQNLRHFEKMSHFLRQNQKMSHFLRQNGRFLAGRDIFDAETFLCPKIFGILKKRPIFFGKIKKCPIFFGETAICRFLADLPRFAFLIKMVFVKVYH